MTNFDSVLANGVFYATSGTGEFDALAELAGDLGRRAFDARVGCRRRPDTFDQQLWDTLVASGLDRLTSDADNQAGPAELAVVLYWLARSSAAVPVAETDLLAAWLMQCADIDVPGLIVDGCVALLGAAVDAHTETAFFAESPADIEVAPDLRIHGVTGSKPGQVLVEGTLGDYVDHATNAAVG